MRLFATKPFDYLIAVSTEEEHTSRCWIEGYISKRDFSARKQASDGPNSKLAVNTWFVDKSDLPDAAELLAPSMKDAAE